MRDTIMRQDMKTIRFGSFGLVIGCVLAIGGACVGVSAQTSTTTTQTPATKRPKETGRDPFKKYEAPKVILKKTGLVAPPPVTERVEQYKAQKAAAMNARMAAPKPTTAFLLSEIQIVGISRTPRGYAAIVEASPIKLSYVVYPGEKFYDGQLVAIEDNRLVFRRETVYADGHRDRTVEFKSLRAPTAVNALTTPKTASAEAAATPGDNKKPEEKPATSEKPEKP